MITRTVGARRIDALDGRDLKRWHTEWSAPLESAASRVSLVRGRH